MMHILKRNAGRRGFTLIELLVVIAIIAVMIGLLLGAVMSVLSKPDDITNRKDIQDLSEALEKFNAKYGVYPPSSILLSNDPTQYQTHPLGPASQKFLLKIWKKIAFTGLNAFRVINPNTNAVISTVDWSGGTMPGKYAVVLEGDQCLVFFLGGMNYTDAQGNLNKCQGFADESANPTDLNALRTGNKVAPFFNFLPIRLVQIHAGNTFLSYNDAYGIKPFAYFSNHLTAYDSYVPNDCLTVGAQPYLSQSVPLKSYVNGKKFQLLSAGRDGVFGSGTWTPNAPAVNTAGMDDQSNFAPGLLGVPN